MTALLTAQMRFAGMVAALIVEAQRQGYGVTLGEAWRSPAEAARLSTVGKGITASLHCQRLAVDLLLFRDGVYLTNTADYEPLGAWWEGQGGAWGGRFTRADGNHFSLAWGGVK